MTRGTRPSRGRGGELERDPRDGDAVDPRDVFAEGLDLPRGLDREAVSLGDERYDLRGSEVRTLATVGAFRVVPIDDLRDHGERAADLWHGDLEHLRSEGLLRHVASVDRESGTDFVTLTNRGRELLEIASLSATTIHVRRSMTVLRESANSCTTRTCIGPTCGRPIASSRTALGSSASSSSTTSNATIRCSSRHPIGVAPTATAGPVAIARRSAAGPTTTTSRTSMAGCSFPDFQMECLWPDGRREIENVEVLTPHYRGAHAASKVRAGFTRFRAIGARAGGRTGRGSRFDPGLAEELV